MVEALRWHGAEQSGALEYPSPHCRPAWDTVISPTQIHAIHLASAHRSEGHTGDAIIKQTISNDTENAHAGLASADRSEGAKGDLNYFFQMFWICERLGSCLISPRTSCGDSG